VDRFTLTGFSLNTLFLNMLFSGNKEICRQTKVSSSVLNVSNYYQRVKSFLRMTSVSFFFWGGDFCV
jgi:hypothetical protein